MFGYLVFRRTNIKTIENQDKLVKANKNGRPNFGPTFLIFMTRKIAKLLFLS